LLRSEALTMTESLYGPCGLPWTKIGWALWPRTVILMYATRLESVVTVLVES
jgi:hypothetical protein